MRSTLYKMGVIKAEKIDPEGHIQLTLEIQRKDYQRLFEYRARPVACAKRSQRRTRDVLRVPAAKPRMTRSKSLKGVVNEYRYSRNTMG
ncbi:hypothetical protein AUR58_11630 [Coxiella burnetii]|nr:hypothetical protein AUR58_11630 [Coxiella burnetii]